jgi:hypothetical protein
MYWTHMDWNSATSEFTNGKIQRAIALDIAGGKMYWTNLNGTEVEDLITGLDLLDGIRLGHG